MVERTSLTLIVDGTPIEYDLVLLAARGEYIASTQQPTESRAHSACIALKFSGAPDAWVGYDETRRCYFTMGTYDADRLPA